MKKDDKQMLLELSKQLITKIIENLNSEMSKIDINLSEEDFEKLFQLNKEINERLEQMKTSIFNK